MLHDSCGSILQHFALLNGITLTAHSCMFIDRSTGVVRGFYLMERFSRRKIKATTTKTTATTTATTVSAA